MEKKRLATVWLGGCSGCHMSLLDIDERILDIAKLADIVKCPLVDCKDFPLADVALVEGAVTSDEHYKEMLHIRKMCKVVVAFGDCAVMTNVTGMRNYYKLQAVLEASYNGALSDDGKGSMPNDDLLLKLQPRVVPLNEVVPIDYYLPGCPPEADSIFYVLNELLNDRKPVLNSSKALHYG